MVIPSPFSPLLVGVLSETKERIEKTVVDVSFSPLLVGVLSETPGMVGNKRINDTPFSPLLVGVLSETMNSWPSSSGEGDLSVPYWSGCSVKLGGVDARTQPLNIFQSPTGRGAQ